MKKVYLSLAILLFLSSYAFEDIPIFPQDSGVNIKYVENQSSLINVDKMKKLQKIKEAQENISQNEKQRIELDSRQIINQRALDFTTKENNSMILPRF